MKALLGAVAVLMLSACQYVYAQDAPTGSFDMTTRINANGTLTPILTWSTTPAAISCVASGDAEWAGPKDPSGTQTLADFPTTTPKAWALVCTWPGQTQALLTWTPPTQNTDGTPLTNLAGYRVSYGTTRDQLTQVSQIANPSAHGHTISDLTPNTWYFGVRAYTTQGAESDLSNIVSRAITGPVEWRQATGVNKPQAPVLGE